jgi:DtxR family Mn-dependent transcriptional regulator
VPQSALESGENARVERVSDRSPERLRYLAELGIVPGTRVQVIAREPFQGPIALRIDDEKRTIGAELASQILVEPLSKRPRTVR